MNTANLQLEGLYLAIAALNRALVDKGLLSSQEVDTALHLAEVQAGSDERAGDDMTAANREAVSFPIRWLRLANRTSDPSGQSFSVLAKAVGQTKQPRNDQM